MKDNKGSTLNDKKDEFKNLCNAIEKSKKIKDPEEMKRYTTEMYEKAKTLDISYIKKFIILFYGYFNKTTSKNIMNDKLVQLTNFSLEKFTKENIHLSIKEEIINLFPKFEIISTQKEVEELEICFALCELSRNIKIMNIFFDEYLNIKVFEPNEYNELDLENQNTINLFEDIFQKVYNEIKKCNKKDDNIKELISELLKNSNKSINNLFRYQKCYDIMQMRLNSEDNIEL